MLCPDDCVLGDWSVWSYGASIQAGGKQTRRRAILAPSGESTGRLIHAHKAVGEPNLDYNLCQLQTLNMQQQGGGGKALNY